MGKEKNKSWTKQYQDEQIDLEAVLAAEITKTGREQVKKRRKAGLSVYFLKDGVLVEETPDNSEVKGATIGAKWITLEKGKRKVVLK